jgi:transcriptional regulator with XRE-family HTH domain
MAKNTSTLKELRTALGMTQKDAALIAGVTRKTLGGWERGENISQGNLEGAAKAYQCSTREVQIYWAKSRSMVIAAKRRVKRVRKKLKAVC